MSENQDGINRVSKEIKESCLRLLARREHSQKELLNKLLVKGLAKDDILAVVEELALQGWQSDLRYAESYARHRIQKGYGPVSVAYELRQNGVDAINLEDIVQQVAGSWMELLEQVYTKKYGHDLLMDRIEWAKRSRFLLHRGFSGAMISALFDQLNIKFS
ncbi:MAG: recombination regulator RecX [Methylococcaceae bacterium]|jgi:regulatory protein|nr:recombination regulator RecX [Methylococcaceae bacterium]MDD1636882.1 recombination regulator RecX [Methylococcaceae bacterium]